MAIRGMVVKNGTVENVAVFDSEDDLFEGWVTAPNDAGTGFTDNGDGTFSAPVFDEGAT